MVLLPNNTKGKPPHVSKGV